MKKDLEVTNVPDTNAPAAPPGVTDEEDARVLHKQQVFKRVCSILFVVAIVAVLIYTAYSDFFASDATLPAWSDVTAIFRKTWYYLIFAVVALAGCYFFKGLRLSLICRRLTGRWHFRTCMGTATVGHYYNYVTPLAVGGQPFEIYYLSKHGVNAGVAASLPIATFFLNQLAFAVLGILSVVFFKAGNVLRIPEFLAGSLRGSGLMGALAILGIVLGLLMPLLTVLFSMAPKIGTALVRFVIGIGKRLRIVRRPEETTARAIRTVTKNASCLRTIATDPAIFILSYLISIGEQLSLYSIPFFTLRFFGFTTGGPILLEWLQILSLCLIYYAAISFIPTPGNSGAADLSFYVLFDSALAASVGVGGLAFPAMITWRLLCFYSFVVIGALFLRKKNAEEKRQADVTGKDK